MKKLIALAAALGISLGLFGCTGETQPKADPNAPTGATTGGATTPGGGAKTDGESKPGGGDRKKE